MSDEVMSYVVSNAILSNKAVFAIEETLKRQQRVIKGLTNAGLLCGLGFIVSSLIFKRQDEELEKLRKDVKELKENVSDLQDDVDVLEAEVNKEA